MPEKRKIIRKISSKLPPKKEETPRQQVVEQVSEENGRDEKRKKICYFCQSKKNPSYTDLANLRRYLTDRAKIVARARSGACAKHQRAIARNIKYARHLAFLPFVPKV